MKNMLFNKIIYSQVLLMATLLSLTFGNFAEGDTKITWINTTASEVVVFHHPEPSGFFRINLDTPCYLLLCRIQVKGRWVPGNLEICKHWYPDCFVADDGERHHHDEFQILSFPRGRTSWVPVVSNLPERAIVGGTGSDGSNIYVCRALYGKSVVVGAYSTKTGICSVPIDTALSRTTDIEILTENLYGKGLTEFESANIES